MTAGVAGRQGAAHIMAAVAGCLIYILVVNVSSVPVAWSTPVYFWLGWPLMCAAIYLLTRQFPDRSWRWPLSMMLGQIFASILYGNGAMVPVAMAYVTVLSIPQFAVAAYVTSVVNRSVASRSSESHSVEGRAETNSHSNSDSL